MEGSQSPSRSTLTLHPNAIATASPLQSYFNLHLESNTPPPDHTILPNSPARTSPPAHTLPPSPPADTCPPAHTQPLSLPYSPHSLPPLTPSLPPLTHIIGSCLPAHSVPPSAHSHLPSLFSHTLSITYLSLCAQALILAGARPIGQSELRAISLECGQPLFPYDFPDTYAGGLYLV